MASAIDPTKPTTGNPTTQSVRDNFTAAKTEIEEIQAALGIAGAGVEYEESPGGGPDQITESMLAHPISAGRYLIKTAAGHVGSVTVHGNGEYEFSFTAPNLIAANTLYFKAFRYDAAGFGVQIRTLNIGTGVMAYTMDKIVRIRKVSL
jgi:hypothetical protein